MLTHDVFLKYLREALNHLHDPVVLRKSPLVILFGAENRDNTFSIMRTILIDAIESMEPKSNGLTNPLDRRIYESLYYRYIQQLGQQEVGDQLGIGIRQLYREQQQALELLADSLWEKFQLGDRQKKTSDEGKVNLNPVNKEMLNSEIAWVKNAFLEKPTRLMDRLEYLKDLLQPLALQHSTHLEFKVPNSLPGLFIHPVAIDQILLNLLSIAFRNTQDGQVIVLAKPLLWDVEVSILGENSKGINSIFSEEDVLGLDIAQQLTGLCHGKLAVLNDTSVSIVQ